jgi:hypothetical protein
MSFGVFNVVERKPKEENLPTKQGLSQTAGRRRFFLRNRD